MYILLLRRHLHMYIIDHNILLMVKEDTRPVMNIIDEAARLLIKKV
ncbi:MAG: hypothetical protein NT178_16630 [Proteobacteria bacterium]|nr:hypothetical protein [Pseudomonadota bacterium]